MVTNAYAGHPFPLYWPEGTPRTPDGQRGVSRYQTDFAQARDATIRRLNGMGARSIVISSNIPLRRDGLPMAGGPDRLQDPGVAVYFSRNKRDLVIACDRWLSVSANMQAVRTTLDALASIERSGSARLLEQAFSGFARLPAQAGPSGAGHWSAALGVAPQYEERAARLGPAIVSWPVSDRMWMREHVESAYRVLARQHHPDHGGSTAAMAELNRAVAEARRDCHGGAEPRVM